MSRVCKICSNETESGKDEVSCGGTCGDLYHYKCIKMSKVCYDNYVAYKQLKYICSACESNPIQMMADKLNVLMEYMYKLDMKIQVQDTKFKEIYDSVVSGNKKALENQKQMKNDIINDLENAGINKLEESRDTYANKTAIIMKPKKVQECNRTRKELQEKINPSELEIGVTTIKNIKEASSLNAIIKKTI